MSRTPASSLLLRLPQLSLLPLPLFLFGALVASLPGCSVQTNAIVGEACSESDAPVCDGEGLILLTCVDGAQSGEACQFGCTPRAESCWICDPGTRRCEDDVILTCENSGTETPSATCVAGTCTEDGIGGAVCGACLPGSSRCDEGRTAVIACGAGGADEPAVGCGPGEECRPGSDAMTASCAAGCVDRCEGDDRVTCTAGEVRETCSLGCDATTVECRVLVPSNVGGAVALDLGTSGLGVGTMAPEVLIFETDDGRIDRYDPATGLRTTVRMPLSGDVDAGVYYEQRAGAGPEEPAGAAIPDLAIWVMDSLTVGRMGTIHFVGTRAAVVLVEGDVLVEGRINARAELLVAGSGGSAFLRAPAGGEGYSNAAGDGFGGGGQGQLDGNRSGGGGGGGFGSQGGPGGGTGRTANGGTVGPVFGDADLVPLYGGSAGGAGGRDVAPGGDGGGALQISAGGTLTISTTGIVDASGEYGYGANSGSEGNGGGGGGSGGGILLEAASISIAGIVGVPGGGGGGGTREASSGAPGSRWDPPTQLRGLRGNGGSSEGGNGGHGSDAAGSGGARGETKDTGNGAGGGGGGGAGRIRLNVRPGTDAVVDGTLVPSGPLSSEGEVGVL